MESNNETLLMSGFINSLKNHPHNIALDVQNNLYTYIELGSISKKIANTILINSKKTESVVALLGYRSISAYAGILGALISGKAYTPLNLKFPIERSSAMLDVSGARTLIVGRECIGYLKELLKTIQSSLLIIFSDFQEDIQLVSTFSQHKFIFSEELNNTKELTEVPVINNDSMAYLLFTSGSTGAPKGVPISHKNATSYIEHIFSKFDFRDTDRFSHTFDLTFDLSIHDMFLSWKSSACLCVPAVESMLEISNYIIEKKITVWFSVPSTAILISKMKLLKKNAFPSLKYSMFCGEILSAKTAGEWQNAAASSTLINLYGPTETTISISMYEWKKEIELNNCINGIVPIGKVFDTHEYCIVDENFESVKVNERGELCISGPQLSSGYFNDEENTKIKFVQISNKGKRKWYRTGDLVCEDINGCLHFLGRLDSQVKIQGYRVELQEIDSVIKKIIGSDLVITLQLKSENSDKSGLVTFASTGENGLNKNEILNHCRKLLPAYMIPNEIYFLDNMPFNSNGKINKNNLLERFDKKINF